ncbi:hypothetical protein GH714_041369 [Hevea brasiliensis]|uniref:Uncharacterized protein n=1 Tax=Hevea brasiliensis TaxID=3981 RepID=A0A6A6MX10_HEVBR|nr:hypothetical protein GH714_041369 [Hevea brasiliensis]
MRNDGWKGLFRGNFVNVIRVAPSKAIEHLIMHVPRVTQTQNPTNCTERSVQESFDAFLKIKGEEGLGELHRGLIPSLIGVVPYAAANYFAYDTLKTPYKKDFKKEEIENAMTLLIGSAAGAISSTATFPLEVA